MIVFQLKLYLQRPDPAPGRQEVQNDRFSIKIVIGNGPIQPRGARKPKMIGFQSKLYLERARSSPEAPGGPKW